MKFGSGTAIVVGMMMSGFLGGCTRPADAPITPDQQTPAFLAVISDPIKGYDTSVDAITKATSIPDMIHVKLTGLRELSDSVKDVVVSYGEGVKESKLDGSFSLDSLFPSHYYLYKSSTGGLCTTTVHATTYGGLTADTSIPVHVLLKSEL